MAAYATGAIGALELLDAEHRLFEVRLASARARADLAIAIAQLEGALAMPLGDAIAKNFMQQDAAEDAGHE